MKIAYITHNYKPYTGGVNYVVEQVAVEISKKHDVEVYTLVPLHSSLPRTEKMDQYVVRRFPALTPSNSYFVPTPSFLLAMIKLKADVVHVHTVATGVPLAVWLAKKFRPQWKLLILTPHFHNIGFSRHANFVWTLYRPILKKIIIAFDIIHSISPHEAKLLNEKLGVHPILIPHALSRDVLSHVWRRPKKFTVVYSGVFRKYKGVDLLIKAMSLVNKKNPEARLMMIGSGYRKAKLVKMAKQLNVNANFLSPMKRNDYLESLANCSVMCYLSESEGFCITVLEAIGIGLPVVAVEPWGNFFKKYSRTAILPPNPTPDEVCEALVSFDGKAFSAKEAVPTWGDVTEIYEKMYSHGLANKFNQCVRK
jgi:glycosyltransferase involved in cell wall biosynthesis